LFKTFDSANISGNDEQNTKTIGIGLSTANSLINYLGGIFKLKDIKNSDNQSVGTEAAFSVPTCSVQNCHHYSQALK